VPDFNAAIKLDPNASLTYNARGLLLESQGDLKGALADYEQAVSLDSEQLAFVRNRGLCYRAVGDVQASLQDLDKFVPLCHDSWLLDRHVQVP
jgi:tetratricopeptide (TPR) repeat protein